MVVMVPKAWWFLAEASVAGRASHLQCVYTSLPWAYRKEFTPLDCFLLVLGLPQPPT